MRKFTKFFALCGLLCGSLFTTACDSSGIPLDLVIDDYTINVDVDNIMQNALGELANVGLIGTNTQSLPAVWPPSLPDINYKKSFITAPVAVDLTVDDDSEDNKYAELGNALKIVNRVDISRMVIRFEKNSLNVATPELALQIADQKDAQADERRSWRTIGIIPSQKAGFIGDIDFEFVPSGERYLKHQLMDEQREFALRIRSTLDLNLTTNQPIPAGAAQIRVILAGTFFIDTIEAISNAEDLATTTN